MLISVALLGLLLALTKLDLHKGLAAVSLPIHEACLRQAPDSDSKPIYQSLVCGAPLPIDDTYHSLRETGLLHLMVVSGSHLVFLELLLQIFLQILARIVKLPKVFIFLLLITFTLGSNAEPPVLRALFQFMISHVQSRLSLGWSPLQCTTLSGFVSFLFCRDSRALQSLLLSWTASLGIASTSGVSRCSSASLRPTFAEKWWRRLKEASSVYLILLPVLLPFSAPHPFSILCNWILGPLLGFILFPSALLTFLIPPSVVLIDPLWSLVETLLGLVATLAPSSGDPMKIPAPPLWIYVLSLNGILLIQEIRDKRGAMR